MNDTCITKEQMGQLLPFERCDAIVRKLVPELLVGTPLMLLQERARGQCLMVVDVAAAYEFRFGVTRPWLRIIEPVQIAALDCIDEPTLVRAITAGVAEAKANIKRELTTIAQGLA